jgi:hypothetical protein
VRILKFNGRLIKYNGHTEDMFFVGLQNNGQFTIETNRKYFGDTLCKQIEEIVTNAFYNQIKITITKLTITAEHKEIKGN